MEPLNKAVDSVLLNKERYNGSIPMYNNHACSRCGRCGCRGHMVSGCFATSDVNGKILN